MTTISTSKNCQIQQGGEASARFWLVAEVASLGGLLFGYDTGVIAGALLYIQVDFGLSTIAEGVVVGVALVGATIGVLASGVVADRFGRRIPILCCAILFIASSLICAFAPNVSFLLIGRLLVGAAVGVASIVTPLYLAEISPPAKRGTIVSFNSLCIVAGMFGAYVLDWWMLDWDQNWRWMLGFGALPGGLLAAGICLLPASPRWLAFQGRYDDAREVLLSMRSKSGAERELRSLSKEAHASKSPPSWKELLDPAYRRALTVGMLLAMFTQITGINAVLYFAPRILERAGGSGPEGALIATAEIGFVNMVFTFVSLLLVDKIGRRPLLLSGLGGIVIALAALGIGGAIGVSSIGYATTCLAVFVAFFAVSLGPVYYVVASEIFPQQIRSRAMGMSNAALWGSNLFVTLLFPTMLSGMGTSGTFLAFAAISAAGLIFVWRSVPETRGLDLDEISELFAPNK